MAAASPALTVPLSLGPLFLCGYHLPSLLLNFGLMCFVCAQLSRQFSCSGSSVPADRSSASNVRRPVLVDSSFREERCANMVTIGLPFCNDARTLVRAIRSVFAQTLTDWELILVDDGSTDGSLEVARRVRDSRVRVISDGQNRGLAVRLNQIARCATGEFVARMDADDLMHPERLERQRDRLQRKPSVSLVDTGLLSIDDFDRPTGTRCCQPLQVTPRGILAGHVPVHAAVFARVEWFRTHPYDEDYRRAQDLELWCRTLSAGQLAVDRVTDPLYFVRESGCATYAKVRLSYQAHRRILRRHGGPLVGWRRTQVALGKIGCRGIVHWAADRCGRHRELVARRNRPLNGTQRQAMLDTIAKVLGTRVPGLIDEDRRSQRWRELVPVGGATGHRMADG